MSYSHAADARLAPALQRGLHRLAKRLWQLRAMRVFRDKTSLSATPELWPSIESALSESDYFILLASPEAAASRWVDREIAWWLEHRDAGRLLLVLTDGTLAWSQETGDFVSGPDHPLPHRLAGVFRSEPLWVDLAWARTDDQLTLKNNRFRGAVLDLAAPLHGKPKDQLDGDDVRRQRAARLAAVTAFVAIAAAAAVAIQQSIEAREQREQALERRDQAVVAAFNEARQRRTAEEARAAAERSERKATDARDQEAEQRRLAVAARNAEEIQRREAERQRNAALARALVAEAEAAFEEAPLGALRTALEGLARVPASLPEVEAELAGRVQKIAATGRLTKLGDSADQIVTEAGFPHLLVVNRYQPSVLLRKADGAPLGRYDRINRQAPLGVTPDGGYFVVKRDDSSLLDLDHDLRRLSDGSHIGKTKSLRSDTLFPTESPAFAKLDRGLSPLVVRLADGQHIGKEGCDIARFEYLGERGEFALAFRDDDFDFGGGGRCRVSPERFDARTGERLGTAESVETRLDEEPLELRAISRLTSPPYNEPRAASSELFEILEVLEDPDDSDAEIERTEIRRIADGHLVHSLESAEVRRVRSHPSGTLVAFNWTDVDDDSDRGGRVVRVEDGEVLWRGERFRRVRFDPAPEPSYFIVTLSGSRGAAAPPSQIYAARERKRLATMAGTLERLEPRRVGALDVLLARFEDGGGAYWSAAAPPRRLLQWGADLADRLELPSSHLVLRYESGDAYLVDLLWLEELARRDDLPLPQRLGRVLCARPLAGIYFDREAWRQSFAHGEPLACQ